MDPRTTPGYRLHRVLTNLNRIEATEVDDGDRKRIETARTLLEDVSLLSHPNHSETTGTEIEF